MDFKKRTIIKFKGRKVFDTYGMFFVGLLLKMLGTPFKGYLLNVTKVVYKYYLKTQYSGVQVIDVALPIDNKIPFTENAVPTYLSFIPYCFAVFLFIHKEFQGRHDREIFESLNQYLNLYESSGSVYASFQSRMSLRQHTNGLSRWLYMIDKNRNCFPSLHAQIVAKAYMTLEKVILNEADGLAKYGRIREEFFSHAVKILEACCVTKQHSVQDIAAGLALLSCLDKNFNSRNAEKFISQMFAGQLPGAEVEETHQIMLRTFNFITQKFAASKLPDFSQICKEAIMQNRAANL